MAPQAKTDAELVDFFKALEYPLTMTLARETAPSPPAEEAPEAPPSRSETDASSGDDREALDEEPPFFDGPVRACASSLLYSSRRRVAHAAATVLGNAAASHRSEARLFAHARAMDVRTATATAMTPAPVMRLSSWTPDEEQLDEGMTRDEAAAMMPLAEATLEETVPLVDNAPRIFADARSRGSERPLFRFRRPTVLRVERDGRATFPGP